MAPGITLVLGGARSGKSAVAEALAAAAGPAVTYVATGTAPDGEDRDWASRVDTHRERRPRSWTTLEVPPGGDLPATLAGPPGPVLLDSLGTWLVGTWLPLTGSFDPPLGPLCRALQARRDAGHLTVVVSEEVGLGVHPSSESGRLFRDALGLLNRAVAAVSDRAVLVVAGRTLELGPAPAPGDR